MRRINTRIEVLEKAEPPDPDVFDLIGLHLLGALPLSEVSGSTFLFDRNTLGYDREVPTRRVVRDLVGAMCGGKPGPIMESIADPRPTRGRK